MKNKIILISFIFILISGLFINNNVFASDNIYNTLPENIHDIIIDTSVMPELADGNYKLFIFHRVDWGYFAHFFTNCSDDFKLLIDTKNGFYYREGTATGVEYYFNEDTGKLIDHNPFKIFSAGWDYCTTDKIYISNLTVYNKDDGLIFFKPLYTRPTYSLLIPLQIALFSSITPLQIVTLLAAIIGAGMIFVLMWFGIRKLIKIFKKALIKGKISL